MTTDLVMSLDALVSGRKTRTVSSPRVICSDADELSLIPYAE